MISQSPADSAAHVQPGKLMEKSPPPPPDKVSLGDWSYLNVQKAQIQYFPPFYYSVSQWLKLRLSRTWFYFLFFSFPSRLLAWAVNFSLSISIKAADEWFFWVPVECLTTPQVSVFLAGKPPGHAPQATKHPLLFCCPSSALKAWFQALRLHFFPFSSSDCILQCCW